MVKVLGRDLVRLLVGVIRIPEVELVFKDVLGAVGQPIAAPTPGTQTNLRILCHTHTPRQFLQSRMSPEMEQWLLFIMQNVRPVSPPSIIPPPLRPKPRSLEGQLEIL